MDPLHWLGAIRIRIQTVAKKKNKHHNVPQVIHWTPVYKLMFCEVKSYMFQRNKSIIKPFLNRCFCPKYDSIIHNNASSSEKKSKSPAVLINLAHWSVHISLLIQMRQLFYWEKEALWIKDYFSQKQFEVKNILMFDLFLTNMRLLSNVDYLWIIVNIVFF